MALRQPVQPSAEALRQGYEPEGVRFWTLLGIMAAIALVIALFMGVGAWLILHNTRDARDAEAAPSFVPAVPINNGLPPLQPEPSHNRIAAQDYAAFDQHESAVFDELGWNAAGPDHKPRVPDAVIAAVAAGHGGGH